MRIFQYIKTFGIEELTEFQKRAFKTIKNGKNVLLVSETGSGKTEAAMLPILDNLLEKKHSKVSVLYITPLRSLNRDMMRRLNKMCREIGIEIYVRHGDTSSYERSMHITNPADIMIITPESLQSMLVGKRIREILKNVRYVIVDEVHEIAFNKRGTQLALALSRLKRISKHFQLITLSATVGNINGIMKLFRIHQVITGTFKKDIEINVVWIENVEERIKMIVDEMKKFKSLLVFTNTREMAEILTNRIISAGYEGIDVHHSSLSKNVRIDVEKGIRNGKIKAIVCTSSLELGIDIGKIDRIVQYGSPRQVVKFLQRAGRSGHTLSGKPSILVICLDAEDFLQALAIVELSRTGFIEEYKIYEKAYDVLLHQVCGMLLEGYRNIDDIYRTVKNSYPYRNLEIDEFFAVLRIGEELRYIRLRDNILIPTKNAFKYYFESISTIPDVKKYRMIDINNKKVIANLDSVFVEMVLSETQDFICKGRVWRVLDIHNDIVLVESSENVDAAVAVWKGELIPVHRKVCEEIIKIFHRFGKNVTYIKERSLEMLKEFVRQQSKVFIPKIDGIYIEKIDDGIVIYTFLGNLANNTLSEIIRAKISLHEGVEGDEFRIFVKGKFVTPEYIVEILKNIDSDDIETILKNSAENSSNFLIRFFFVCQRFGIVKRNSNVKKSDLKKILKIFKNTLIEKEAFNEFLKEKNDIEVVKQFLKRLRKTLYKKVDGVSKLTECMFRRKYEYIRDTSSIEKIVFNRIMNTKLILFCLNCKNFIVETRVKDIGNDFRCKNCSAIMLAPLKIYEHEKVNKYIKGDKDVIEDMVRRASVFMNYKKRFLMAFSGIGIGINGAIKICEKVRNEADIIKFIIEEERKYMIRKRFLV